MGWDLSEDADESRPRREVLRRPRGGCSGLSSTEDEGEFISFASEWPLVTPLLLWPLLEFDAAPFRLLLAGEAGGVALEHIFLATGSGDRRGGECE